MTGKQVGNREWPDKGFGMIKWKKWKYNEKFGMTYGNIVFRAQTGIK